MLYSGDEYYDDDITSGGYVPQRPRRTPIMAQTTVTLATSYRRADGTGYDTLEIGFPVEGTLDPAKLDQILTRWEPIRTETLARFETMNQPKVTPEEALAYELTFGKWRDSTLGEVLEADRAYLEWLSQEANNLAVRYMAKVVLDIYGRMADEANAATDPENLPY